MKIVLSAGNRIGANLQLSRNYQALIAQGHQVKTAGYLGKIRIPGILDWTLNAIFHPYQPKISLTEFLGQAGCPKVVQAQFEALLQALEDFEPDLIISDGEPLLAYLAKLLQIPLWYCSPLHLLDGLSEPIKVPRHKFQIKRGKEFLRSLPLADRYLISSPWSFALSSLALKSGYSWIRPEVIGSCPPESTAQKSGVLAVHADLQRSSKMSQLFSYVSQTINIFEDLTFDPKNPRRLELDSSTNYKENLATSTLHISAGESSFLADAISNGLSNFIILPAADNLEALLNILIGQELKMSVVDLGQLELLKSQTAIELLQAAIQSYFGRPSYPLPATMFLPTLAQKVAADLCM